MVTQLNQLLFQSYRNRVRHQTCHTDPLPDPTRPKSLTRYPVPTLGGSVITRMITAVTVIAESCRRLPKATDSYRKLGSRYNYRKLGHHGALWARVRARVRISARVRTRVSVSDQETERVSSVNPDMRPDSVAFGIADDPGLRYSLHFASCRQLPSPVYFTAVYSERTPATTYLSNAFRALFVDRVADEDHFASSFRNLRSVPEFWSVRPCVYFPSV